jgi:hypothetical protein
MPDRDALLAAMRTRYLALKDSLNEVQRRHWAAAEAMTYGWGGHRVVSQLTGMAMNTITKAVAELKAKQAGLPSARPKGKLRLPGGGRKSAGVAQPGLVSALERLVSPVTRGEPTSALRWTAKSTACLAKELCAQGYRISRTTVAELLKAQGYSLQSTRKTKEGGHHPERDAQFAYLNSRAQAFHAAGQPVISVDAKKKELVGEYRQGGREWQPKQKPEEVKVYDFVDKEKGKAMPYGVYDVGANEGWVSVGCDHDTAPFAVETIGRWWEKLGRARYEPKSTAAAALTPRRELLICADGGGSNGSRCRLWKVALQGLADRLQMPLEVCHLPPGTSKWNKIEHRLFSFITLNWRGRPLISHEIIVSLIASTTTATGLKVKAELDRGFYPTGTKVSDEELAQVNLHPAAFHGEWNYRILPAGWSEDSQVNSG